VLSHPRAPLAADVALALVLCVLLVVVVRPSFHAPGSAFDEGFALAYPARVLEGDVPNRDFSSFYGPGNPWLLAGAFAVAGSSQDTERVVGILYRLLIVLGVPPTWWFPLTLVRGFLAAVQHTELDWSYGPFYRIVVSPVFHRLHHSSARADFDSNYSQLFCIWDYMFGTANPARTPPTSVGVAGLPPEPTLAGQLWGPFRRIFRPRGGREAAPKSARRVTPSGLVE
jgi:hypothetical protein